MALVGTGTPSSLEIDHLELDALGGTLRVDGLVSWRPDVRWELAFEGDGLEPNVLLSDTSLYDTRLSAQGRTTGELVSGLLTASVDIDTLAGPIRGDTVAGVAVATVVGTAQEYHARVDAELARVHEPVIGGSLLFVGRGTTESVEIDSLEIDALDGAFRAEGRLAWSPHLRWSVSFDAEDLHVGRIAPDTTLRDTRVGVEGSTTGERFSDRVSATMTIDTLAGEIRGEAIHGSAAAAVDLPLGAAGIRLGEANVSVDRLDVSWRQGRLEASGVVADTVDLSVGLSLPDLSMASPGTVGSAEVDLRARGSRAQPRAELTMAARGLAIDTAATAQPLLDSLTVRVSGTPASHEAEVHAGRGGGTVDLGLAGTYADGVWAGAVDRLDLADPEAGSWQLGEPATVAASVDSVRLERTCLAQAPSLACASGLWHAGGTSSGEIVLEELTGHRLAELLPPGWSIDGRLGARASGTLEPDGTLRGDGRVDLGSGTIELGRGVVRRRLTYSDVGLEAAIDEEGARLSMATELFDESGALAVLTEIVVALPGYDNVRDPISEQALSGFVRSSVPDLGAFQYAIPDLEPVEGSVEVDVTLAGTLAEVEVEGDVRLRGGAVDVPRAGLQLRDIEVAARGRGADGIELDASARSDTGTLRVSGRAPVGPTESEPARIEVIGTRVRALGLPDASVWISPNLEVIAWPDGLRVSGEVTVPEARIELTELPATVVQASDDVVFVDDTTTIRLARALAYSVRLTLGDSVTFHWRRGATRPMDRNSRWSADDSSSPEDHRTIPVSTFVRRAPHRTVPWPASRFAARWMIPR
jgi:translocation and assembly module TamB